MINEIYDYFGNTNTIHRCFKGGGSPDIPKQEPVEVITKIEETKSEEVNRQKRASYLAGGKQSTMLSGLQSQLDQRLNMLKGKLGA
jgi:hypothetical protein